MSRSTAMAPRVPRAAPAPAARLVSGRTPTTTRTRSASRVTAAPPAAVASTRSRPAWPGAARLIWRTVVPVSTSTPWLVSWSWTQGAEFGVDGGQDLGQLFHLGDGQPAGGERVGHLQADVAGADDHRDGRCSFLQGAHEGEGVAHRVQQVHAVGGAELVQAADRGPDRDGAGADDELVVADQLVGAAGGGDQELAGGDVDAAGGGVQPQPHPGGLQVGGGAVGEVAPVGDLAGDVVGDAADGEVRVGVRDDHADVGGRVELAGAQRGADPGVAAADHDQVHGSGSRSAVLVSGAGRGAAATGHGSCGTMMLAAWPGVSRGYSARITPTARAPPRTWAPMNAGAEAGAIPAKRVGEHPADRDGRVGEAGR